MTRKQNNQHSHSKLHNQQPPQRSSTREKHKTNLKKKPHDITVMFTQPSPLNSNGGGGEKKSEAPFSSYMLIARVE